MICTIAVTVWNRPAITGRCLESIAAHTDYPHRVLIIDNGSNEETRKFLQDFCRGRNNFSVQRFDENIGYLKAANFVLERADTPYICLLNNDTVVTGGWLTECISILDASAQAGIVSPTSNEITDKFRKRSLSGSVKSCKGKSIEVNSCLGSCFIIKREVVGRVGYFDTAYGNGYFEEVDYCFRARAAGYASRLALGAYIEHVGNVSFGAALKERDELWHRNRAILEARWGKQERMLVFLRGRYERGILEETKDYLLERCRSRAIIEFCSRDGGAWADGLHFNIRRRSPAGYNFLTLYLMVALKKKAYDTVVTDIPMPSLIRNLLKKKLKGFYDFARLEAFDADADSLRRSVHDSPDGL